MERAAAAAEHDLLSIVRGEVESDGGNQNRLTFLLLCSLTRSENRYVLKDDLADLLLLKSRDRGG